MRSTSGKMAVCLPWSLVGTHMTELAGMEPRTGKPIAVQLVLLPPYASDVTPEAPPQEVIDLKHGITVRKTKPASVTTPVFALSGLPLARSRPVQESWYLRGERGI